MVQINYAAYQELLATLKEKTKNLLVKTKNQDLASKLDDELDSVNDRQKLSIAFVGQYTTQALQP